GADCSRVARALDFVPTSALRDGLAQQIAWQRELEGQRERRLHLVAQSLTPALSRQGAVPGTSRAPRILLYSHDTFGLGHLRRNLAIAGRLSHALPGCSLLLLSGSQAVQQFVLPLGADIIKLPTVTKLGHEHYVAQRLSITPSEVLALRRG